MVHQLAVVQGAALHGSFSSNFAAKQWGLPFMNYYLSFQEDTLNPWRGAHTRGGGENQNLSENKTGGLKFSDT